MVFTDNLCYCKWSDHITKDINRSSKGCSMIFEKPETPSNIRTLYSLTNNRTFYNIFKDKWAESDVDKPKTFIELLDKYGPLTDERPVRVGDKDSYIDYKALPVGSVIQITYENGDTQNFIKDDDNIYISSYSIVEKKVVYIPERKN